MSFADPQTVTINTVAQTLNKVKSEGTRTEYSKDDESVKMTISHSESKGRTRRMVRLDQRVVAADPLTAVNSYQSLGCYLVIDEPEYGFSDTEIGYLVSALTAWLGVAGNVGKICSSQS